MDELSCAKKLFVNYADNVIKSNKIFHAYLIEVDNYDEDYNYVLSFIKMILCGVSYNELSTCDNDIINLLDSNNYPDLYVISSNTSVINKQLITNLQKEFSNKSMLGNKKIYIIKEAEKLNDASSNTILKFLEEPEEDIIAFILCDNRYHVFDTILSRCQILSLKENTYSYNVDDNFVDLLDCIVNPENYFIKYKDIITLFSTDKSILRKQFMDIESAIIDYLTYDKFNEDLAFFLKNKNEKYLINIISILENEIKKLDYNLNMKLWFDSLFSKLIGG